MYSAVNYSAVALVVAEGALAVNAVVWLAAGHWWSAAGWLGGMWLTWKFKFLVIA